MAACDDCFDDFVHPLTHEARENNRRFREKYGQYARWDWDDERSTLTFSDPDKTSLEIDVSIVGTTQGNSWEWSWANSNISPKCKVGIEEVRKFGESEGYDKLTSKFLEADEYTGWKMTAVAAHLLNALGTYRFPTDDSCYCYLLFRKISVLSVQ
jgi:hypothetical protein